MSVRTFRCVWCTDHTLGTCFRTRLWTLTMRSVLTNVWVQSSLVGGCTHHEDLLVELEYRGCGHDEDVGQVGGEVEQHPGQSPNRAPVEERADQVTAKGSITSS